MNMITKQTKLIIFDMDGLLVDTERVYKEGWEYALCKEHQYVPMEILNSWTGKSMHETSDYLMNLCHSEELCEKIRSHREEYIYACIKDGTLDAKPYAREALEKAYRCGYTIGLATSTSKKRSVDILTKLGMFQYIHFPVFAEDVALLKPNPDSYLEVLNRANEKPENAVVFEDSLTGYQAAKAANIPTVLIPDQSFKISETLLTMKPHMEKKLSVIITWIDRINEMR